MSWDYTENVLAKQLFDMFTSIAQKYYDNTNLHKNQVVLLAQARGRLLPKLMSGELEV
jgi:hypothetical protein